MAADRGVGGYGQDTAAKSGFPEQVSERAFVTLGPCEARSPPGIQRVFLNLVYRWENQGSMTAE